MPRIAAKFRKCAAAAAFAPRTTCASISVSVAQKKRAFRSGGSVAQNKRWSTYLPTDSSWSRKAKALSGRNHFEIAAPSITDPCHAPVYCHLCEPIQEPGGGSGE